MGATDHKTRVGLVYHNGLTFDIHCARAYTQRAPRDEFRALPELNRQELSCRDLSRERVLDAAPFVWNETQSTYPSP